MFTNNVASNTTFSFIASEFTVHWTITATMVLGLICLLMCAVYSCIGDDKNNYTSSQPYKEKDKSNKTDQIPSVYIDCRIDKV